MVALEENLEKALTDEEDIVICLKSLKNDVFWLSKLDLNILANLS